MSEATNKIKARIMALLAKANGTDNEHEAEVFLAKAHELLAQYQLDIADLVDQDDPILHHPGYCAAESGHAWRWKLYSAIAQLYGCKSIHVQGHYLKNEDGSFKYDKRGRLIPSYEQRLVGRESSIITAELMYPWIVSQVRQKGREIAEVTGMSEQGQTKRVAAALISRIHGIIRANQEQAPKTEAGRNALIILNQVVAKYDELYPSTENMRGGPARTDGLSRAAADSIGLHRQTGGASQLKLGRG